MQWFVQKNGLVTSASLAVILVHLRLKEYDLALRKEVPKLSVQNEGNKEGALPLMSEEGDMSD